MRACSEATSGYAGYQWHKGPNRSQPYGERVCEAAHSRVPACAQPRSVTVRIRSDQRRIGIEGVYLAVFADR